MTRQEKFNQMMALGIHREIIKQTFNLPEWDFCKLQARYVDSRIQEKHLLSSPKLDKAKQIEDKLWFAMEGRVNLAPGEFEALKNEYAQFNVFE